MHRRFKAVLLFALTGFGLLGSSFAENPQVTVSVYNDVEVSPDTLTQAEQRAANIFLRAGFDVTWLNCAQMNGGTAACNEMDEPAHLSLRITSQVARSTSDTAFGVAFLASDGTGRYGDVFWKRAQELHANSKVDLALILGSVMAHEMGHLLLGSNAHAISGIMRAHWESTELRRIAMGTLLFLPEQGRRMGKRMAGSRTVPISSLRGCSSILPAQRCCSSENSSGEALSRPRSVVRISR